jgi:hypothetical protein
MNKTELSRHYSRVRIDWRDPKQRRAYKREWMRRQRRSSPKNFRAPVVSGFVVILGVPVKLGRPPLPPLPA